MEPINEDTTLDSLPRYQPSNPYHLTEEQIARRNRDVKAAAKDFPNVPEWSIEHAWSLIETKSKDELEQMLMAEKKVRNISEGGMVIEQAEPSI